MESSKQSDLSADISAVPSPYETETLKMHVECEQRIDAALVESTHFLLDTSPFELLPNDPTLLYPSYFHPLRILISFRSLAETFIGVDEPAWM